MTDPPDPPHLVVGLFLDGPCAGERGEVPPPDSDFEELWRCGEDGLYHSYEWTDRGLRYTGQSYLPADLTARFQALTDERDVEVHLRKDSANYGGDG